MGDPHIHQAFQAYHLFSRPSTQLNSTRKKGSVRYQLHHPPTESTTYKQLSVSMNVYFIHMHTYFHYVKEQSSLVRSQKEKCLIESVTLNSWISHRYEYCKVKKQQEERSNTIIISNTVKLPTGNERTYSKMHNKLPAGDIIPETSS